MVNLQGRPGLKALGIVPHSFDVPLSILASPYSPK
jgi:hypothetical protein